MATYYLSNTDVTAGVYDLLATSAPASQEEASGWNVDKVSADASPWVPNTVQAKTTFVTEPSAFGQVGYRTQNVLNGDFATGTWTLYYEVVNDATYYAQQGTVKFRLWRSANADGSSATQITSGWNAASTITWSAGSQYKTGFITTASITGFSMTDEYLFVEVEWVCSASGGNNAAYVYWCHNNGSEHSLSTPTYTPDAVSHDLAGSGTFVGGGTSAGTVETVSHDLAGSGALTGGGTSAGDVVSPLTGSGTITGGGTSAGTVEDVVHDVAGSGTLTGGGTSAGDVVSPLAGSGTITGGGSSAGTVESVVQDLAGSGTVVGGGTSAGDVVAPLDGSGTFVGGGSSAGTVVDLGLDLAGSGSFAGGGTSAGTVEDVVHDLVGSGSFTGGGTTAGDVVALLTGSGTITGGGSSAGTVEDPPAAGTYSVFGGEHVIQAAYI